MLHLPSWFAPAVLQLHTVSTRGLYESIYRCGLFNSPSSCFEWRFSLAASDIVFISSFVHVTLDYVALILLAVKTLLQLLQLYKVSPNAAIYLRIALDAYAVQLSFTT
jgi:hypothetical protein